MMGRLAEQLAKDRNTRNALRGTFDERLAKVRQDIDARGVGGRIADRVGEDARDILDEAVDIADRHRGVVAGTIALVAIWIFRNPIIALIERLMGAEDEKETRDEQG